MPAGDQDHKNSLSSPDNRKTQVLSSMPSMLGLFIKAVKKKGHGVELPPLAVSVAGVRADRQMVSHYERICHFPESCFLPATLLHVLAFPLHLQLVTASQVPLTPMGLVHIGNVIHQYRPVEKSELLFIECRIGQSREVARGLEFDMITRIEAAGELVYEGISTNLSRRGSRSPSPGRKKRHQPFPCLDIMQTWSLPGDLGRRYGAVSGDRNPVHLWPVTARMFGFKRPIAHGMWSKGRCLAALADFAGRHPFVIEVTFKTPIYLPGSVEFSCSEGEQERLFRLRASSGKPHLQGRLKLL